MLKKKNETENENGKGESVPKPTEENVTDPEERGLWRDWFAYWILGLCNNCGYVVMLSAAYDIIGFGIDDETPTLEGMGEGRDCLFLSTGIILLADIIPEFIIITLSRFLPFWMNLRIGVAIVTSALGFLLVSIATTTGVAVGGVILTSFSCGLGGTSLLAYSAAYNKNVICAWSSGTGGAGVLGSTSYALLREAGLSATNTMVLMLIVPVLEAAAFWIFLRHPKDKSIFEKKEPNEGEEEAFSTLKEQFLYIRSLLKYMKPLNLVYFFEYLINQGLFELVYFKNIFIDHASQYHWLNVFYQIGVLISRSSINIVQIPWLWTMAFLQFINVLYFLTEVIFFYTPTIWIVVVVILWEGLLGGGSYVNSYHKMTKELEPSRIPFAMTVALISNTVSIMSAAFLAMAVHKGICSLDVK